MDFIIHGRIFSLKNIDKSVDEWFVKFYKAYFLENIVVLDEFEKIIHKYFDKIEEQKNREQLHDDLFNSFITIWNVILSQRNYGLGEWIWEKCVDFSHHWEEMHEGRYIHKGTPFYFWGMTAILRGDMDKGYALMHKALQEDVRRHGSVNPQTPSFAFVIADYKEKNQAFIDWPLIQAKYIEDRINLFNQFYQKNFSLNLFWEKITRSNLEKSIIYQFVLYITKFYDITRKPEYIYKGDFAGQLLLDLLLNLARVVDSIIHQKNPSEQNLFNHILFVNNAIDLNLNQLKMEYINQKYKSIPNGFENTITSIIDNSFRFCDNSPLSDLAKPFAITYGIRNYAAHHIVSSPTIWENYEEIEKNMFFSLFICIDTLYK